MILPKMPTMSTMSEGTVPKYQVVFPASATLTSPTMARIHLLRAILFQAAPAGVTKGAIDSCREADPKEP
jgi:hypothetical protein